jgi:6-phosphofructokinase 1
MRQQNRKIAINTGGGDAPGLNAVIHSAVLAAQRRGWEVYGIRDGYDGLLQGGADGVQALDAKMVAGITSTGGTILGTSNRGSPFECTQADGAATDQSEELMRRFREAGFDALIAIGGDGSLSIALELYRRHGLPVVGVPKTIDNDLLGTDVTFGFDTAVNTATDALDKVVTTAASHHRVMVVELMGRYAGWIALHAGLAGSADVVLIPEIPFDLDRVCERIRAQDARGKRYNIVVVAEGARPRGEEVPSTAPGSASRQPRLGGIGRQVALEIEARTGKETRDLVLGHLQRGGQPSALDRLLALRLGSAAVRLIESGHFGHMAGLNGQTVIPVPLEEATRTRRLVPVDSDIIETARDLGTCLGD